MPRLIGIIAAPIPHQVMKGGEGAPSYVTAHVAFDDEGRAWALVQKHEKIESHPHGDLVRVTLDRFHLVQDIPFVTEAPIPLFLGRRRGS